MQIGYHASHEQFSPAALTDYIIQAEAAGFSRAMCSDHLAPWNRQQGQSGFCWSWLGAAMQATQIPFGSLAIPGGWRYHPVIVAQAAATLAQMFPSRFAWIAVGSGEALNEKPVGKSWPDKAERQIRLKEGVDIIRALWRGETVNHDGLLQTENARLWTLPPETPRIIGAALSPETAEWMGGWADGLITVNQSTDRLEKIIRAFRKGGGQAKSIDIQIHVSWAEEDACALRNAYDQWHTNILPPDQMAELATPDAFERESQGADAEQLKKSILISSQADRHTAWLKEFESLGFDAAYIHNVGKNQSEFIRFYSRSVIPKM